MSGGWREPILAQFTQAIAAAARLTIVSDPDQLLSERGVLEGIRDRGFDVIPFEDHVAFRYAYESRYRQAWDRVVVTPAEDFAVEAADFQLEDGLLKLRGLAGLDDISTKVPMNFTFVFEGTASFALTEEIEPRSED